MPGRAGCRLCQRRLNLYAHSRQTGAAGVHSSTEPQCRLWRYRCLPGAFSHINGDQLQRFVKQIMGNAAGYFFDLALQTTVPEMKQAKDFLQSSPLTSTP